MRIIGLLTATILFISALPANSEEIVMECVGDTFKYKSGIIRKSVKIRQEGQWQSWCVGKRYTLKIHDQSGVCTYKGGEKWGENDRYMSMGHTIILDFYLQEWKMITLAGLKEIKKQCY